MILPFSSTSSASSCYIQIQELSGACQAHEDFAEVHTLNKILWEATEPSGQLAELAVARLFFNEECSPEGIYLPSTMQGPGLECAVVTLLHNYASVLNPSWNFTDVTALTTHKTGPSDGRCTLAACLLNMPPRKVPPQDGLDLDADSVNATPEC